MPAPGRLAHFRTAARHLGAFNAAYTTGRPIPRDPWLSRGWLRGWTERAESIVARLPSLADHAVVRQVLSPAMITSLIALWADRTAFFDALDALPQTLCHRDAFPSNLFVRPTQDGDQLVAVDWAFIGPGAIGEEMAPLVGASLAFLQVIPPGPTNWSRSAWLPTLRGYRMPAGRAPPTTSGSATRRPWCSALPWGRSRPC